MMIKTDVEIDNHVLHVPVRGKTSLSYKYKVPAIRFSCVKRIPSLTHHTHDSLINIIVAGVCESLSAPLREYDPRFGLVLRSWPDSIFTRSPLFDPPRIRGPRFDEAPALDTLSCAFCGSNFSSHQPAMWSGGNIFWTHPPCWVEFADSDSR